MTRLRSIRHEFVDFIPQRLEEGVVYVSMEFATATHRCLCGCGLEVVTPISPTDWKLSFDGETISLTPSVGNWSFPCQSHYWIRNNQVDWAAQMSPAEIARVRAYDKAVKQRYFGDAPQAPVQPPAAPTPPRQPGIWEMIKRWFT
jgi:hypothetical protein